MLEYFPGRKIAEDDILNEILGRRREFRKVIG
jgi:hypothetical protein